MPIWDVRLNKLPVPEQVVGMLTAFLLPVKCSYYRGNDTQYICLVLIAKILK
jgi:hypothetical protein